MNKHFKNSYTLACCKCTDCIITITANSRTKAVLLAHINGWASTSIERPTAHHICPSCATKTQNYSTGVPFGRSVFTELATDHHSQIGRVTFTGKPQLIKGHH